MLKSWPLMSLEVDGGFWRPKGTSRSVGIKASTVDGQTRCRGLIDRYQQKHGPSEFGVAPLGVSGKLFRRWFPSSSET